MQDRSSSDLCLALVSREGPVHAAFRRFFDACGVRLFHAKSISDLFRTLPENRINGIVADIPVLVRAGANEKMLYEGIESVFPNVRVNWNERAGFRVLYADPSRSGEENLREFLNRCLLFTPRSLRKNDRKSCHLNVLFRLEGESAEAARKAFTMDVSHGGLFTCTCDPPAAGSVVSIAIHELTPHPFRVGVRWRRSWGDQRAVPGFGGRFLDLTQEQKRALDELLV